MAEMQVGVFEGMQQGPTAGDRSVLVLTLLVQVLQAQAGQGAARTVQHGVQAAQHLGGQHAARLKFLRAHPAGRVAQSDIDPSYRKPAIWASRTATEFICHPGDQSIASAGSSRTSSCSGCRRASNRSR